MIIDSFVIVAVVFAEQKWDEPLAVMTSTSRLQMSVANWLACFIVVESKRFLATTQKLESLLARLRIEHGSVNAEQAPVAGLAYQQFGRGHHSAGLNDGDCFAYALAKVTGEPLLFKGNDFSQTDIKSGLTS